MKIGFITILALLPMIASAQVGSGLETNAEYMQLLDYERGLSSRKDSLSKAITLLRDEFRADKGNRGEYSARILQLEKELFEVNAQVDEAAAKLVLLQESFIMGELQDDAPVDTVIQEDTPPVVVKQSTDLSSHDAFRELLPQRDYAALIRAQSQEVHAVDLARKYMDNYAEIEKLAASYAATDNALAADSIYTLYLSLSRDNQDIAGSLGDAWHDIYDNKLFAYNYLLQSRNQTRLLTRLETVGRDVRDEIADRRGDTASEELSEYLAQKKHIFEYEKAIAGMLDQSAAVDSLNRAGQTFERLRRQLPKIDLKEKYFIDYSDISFRNPAAYTVTNPIPETAVYRRGVVYRIRMGSYPAKQAVSIFKGAYPLGYLNESGKWDYYAGSFSDLSKAETALEDVVKRGFRNARIAVWNDGEMLLLDDKPIEGKAFRVEITGTKTGLPDLVRDAILRVGDGVDISISDGIYIAGPFTTSLEAETVADAARKAGSESKSELPLSIRTVMR